MAVKINTGILLLSSRMVLRTSKPDNLAKLIRIVSASVGAPRGIVAGQAWESEQRINLANYHQEKTGALFAAATKVGAILSNQENKVKDALEFYGKNLAYSYLIDEA